MSKREDYEQKASALLMPILEEKALELVDVEYVKEAGTWYLRCYIDKPGGVTIQDCEAVSRLFSDRLDEEDFIEESYIMEMSSPGLDRPLKKDKDFERCLGKDVEVHTFAPIEKQKMFIGVLKAYGPDTLTIEEETGKERVFARKDAALVRQAVVF